MQIGGFGYGIRCIIDPWARDPDPGSGMGKIRIRDEHSRSFFREFIEKQFWGKNTLILYCGSGICLTLCPGSGWRSGINIPRIRNTARMYTVPFPYEEDCDAAGEDDQATDGHYHRQDVERGIHRRQGLLQYQNFGFEKQKSSVGAWQPQGRYRYWG